MTTYRIVIPNTGHVIEAVTVFERAKARAEWHRNRLAHPTYPAEIIVQRVGPVGACSEGMAAGGEGVSRQYTPSNGTEGDSFQARWCRRCACDDEDAVMQGESDGCPILADALACGKPSQWVQDVPGGPLCTAFIERTGPGVLNPFQVQQDRARYDALPRDPATGRPVIA